jgi:hypothetical protein
MRQLSTTMRFGSGLMALVFGLVLAAPALAADLILKKGTDVQLEFASSLSSKTAKPGDKVSFKVVKPVQVDGTTVIADGTPVTGTVEKVDKRGRYGVNAHIQLKLAPIRTVSGKHAPLGFHTKGQDVSSKTGEAAGATIGGAVLLGPVGLVGGYFIVGKNVNAKPGDKMTVDIDKDTVVRVR